MFRGMYEGARPTRQRLALPVQRWMRLSEMLHSLKSSIQQLFAGNIVEVKQHVGGMLHLQMNSSMEHFKLVEYTVSSKDKKLIQSDKGVVMCLPEFAYFLNLMDEFTKEIKETSKPVPCYKLRG